MPTGLQLAFARRSPIALPPLEEARQALPMTLLCLDGPLVSHYSGILAILFHAMPPRGAIGFRGELCCDVPPQGLSLDCDRPFFMERSGGVAAIVCDTTENTVRKEYCYTCLAMGGGVISVGSLSAVTVWSRYGIDDEELSKGRPTSWAFTCLYIIKKN